MKAIAARSVIVFMIALLMSACNLQNAASTSVPDAGQVATLVAATLQGLASPTGPSVPLASPTAAAPTQTVASTATPTPPATATIQPTATPLPGAISGGVYGYPYGGIPALSFVAFNQSSHSWFWWVDVPGQSFYSTDNFITPGTYLVVAYDPSGHSGACSSTVTVVSNTAATCDVNSWGGSYPAKPAGVP
jgi:hypothetical protein